jgi:NAD(P)-dependent dehydrogenase (short-subunit alcohol dehydrogenase family)
MAIVLVTGASGGIGSAICRVLARRGATLALHYQSDRAGAEEARRSLEGTGHVLVQADLAEPASIERLWRDATRLGPVDALINNAGIFPDHPPLASSFDEWTRAWERTLAVNLVGAAHLSYCAARTMTSRGQENRQRLFARCLRGEPTAPGPCRQQGGLNASASPWRRRWRAHGVSVLSWPGLVATERQARAAVTRRCSPISRHVATAERRAGRGLLRARCAGQHDGRNCRCERRVVPAQLSGRRRAPMRSLPTSLRRAL